MKHMIINKRYLNNIANAVRQYFSPLKRKYTIAEITNRISSYDALSSIRTDYKISAYLAYIEAVNYTRLMIPDVSSSVMRIPSYFFSGPSTYGAPSMTVGSIIDLPECSYIGNYAFGNCSSLTTLSCPQCKIIGSYAFSNCTWLSDIYLPVCQKIGRKAFYACSDLRELSFPECTFLAPMAFSECGFIQKINLPRVISIFDDAFRDAIYLSEIALDNCIKIGNRAFEDCRRLTDIYLPKCEYIGNDAFRSCIALEQIDLPMCTYIGERAFADNTNLQVLSISACSIINEAAFYNCNILRQIYLTNSNPTRFIGMPSTFFNNTPFDKSYSGSIHAQIYVKSELYAYYTSMLEPYINLETLAIIENDI